MNFRTTSTIEEQMNHVKKYALLLLLNIPRKYQYLLYSIPFLAIFADFVFNLLNHIYFLCIFDFFLFIVTIHTIISLRKKIMIPESISSGILNPNSIIEIEITDKQIIGVLPNKTIIKDLSKFANYMIVKDGVFLMMNNKKEKNYILYIPSKKQELILLFKEKKIKGI